MGRATGRNLPCPCGSGTKYKRCCANAPPHWLDDEPVSDLVSDGQWHGVDFRVRLVVDPATPLLHSVPCRSPLRLEGEPATSQEHWDTTLKFAAFSALNAQAVAAGSWDFAPDFDDLAGQLLDAFGVNVCPEHFARELAYYAWGMLEDLGVLASYADPQGVRFVIEDLPAASASDWQAAEADWPWMAGLRPSDSEVIERA